MEIGDFAGRFRADIRARLDWALLARSGARVEVETLSGGAGRRRLAELFTVWYVDGAGAGSRWDAPGSRPLRVEESERALSCWPEDRRRAVVALARSFAAGTGPLDLTVPAYRVGEGRHVLLDGNHRAVAAHLVPGRDLRLTLWALTGPVREDILPDLRHYAVPPG
ncbi:hypothetical protein [Streptomyces sp. NRRL F-5123]|uniref:hypothetical protein n=1 Tax=Streptomyces sp. NRRL F-5123 TaxID=1463856 RepID=UPI0004E0F143|nr:hypothetical protein [Streptomyces sp. NRRL F-5123]